MKFTITTTFLALIPFLLLGQQNRITKKSIGSLELCQSIDSISAHIISDTLFNADGFYFYGRYYGVKDNGVLVGIDSDSMVNSLSTKSSIFKNTDNIGVGSSLEELLSSFEKIQATSVIAESPDFYLFHTFPNSRIEYRLNYEGIYCFNGQEILDKHYLVSELKGVREKAKIVGSKAKIISIAVVPTSSCRQ